MRYPMTAPASFSWKDESGNQCKGEGTSRDVSETGAFIFAFTCPPAGADVTLRIVLVAKALRVEVDGRVLRVEQGTGAVGNGGFAVLTSDAILRESEESTSEENPSAN